MGKDMRENVERDTPKVDGYVMPFGTQWAVRCPWCGLWHFHGVGEGLSGAHCMEGPGMGRSYDVVATGLPFTDEMNKEARRLRKEQRKRQLAERRAVAKRGGSWSNL